MIASNRYSSPSKQLSLARGCINPITLDTIDKYSPAKQLQVSKVAVAYLIVIHVFLFRNLKSILNRIHGMINRIQLKPNQL